MKILITGADGYLGSRAVRYYSREHTVLAPTHAQMDICDDESVRTYVLRNRPDAILHCAAISDVGRCDEEPVLSQKINVEGSVNMAQAAKVVGAKCLLCSSDQVYTGSGGTRPHAETESLCPKNTYGRQKREAEVRCHAVNPDCVLLRLSWLYDTQTIHPREHGDLIKMLLNGTLMAFSAQDRRGVTDVNEVIRNTEKALRLSGGIYNFGALSREGMLATMREALHGFLRVEATEDEIPCNLSMDTSLCRANGIVFRDTAAALRKNFARAATRVRPMRMEEAELLKTFLLHAIFVPDGEAEPDASILAKEELQVYVRDFGTEKTDVAFVAESLQGVVGICWARIMNDYGHLDDATPSLAISVLPSCRNAGLGEWLLREMCAALRAQGRTRVSLSVQKANPAMRLYARCGFEIVRENAEDVLMCCELR